MDTWEDMGTDGKDVELLIRFRRVTVDFIVSR